MPKSSKVEMWEARDGRWYFHHVAANGAVTAGNSCASRRSARRSIHRNWPGVRIVVV